MNLHTNYFYNQDSLVGLKSMADETVDLVLSDPPYGIADKKKLTKSGNKIVTTTQAWGNDFQDSWSNVDSYYQWLKPFLAEMTRVMKDGASMVLYLDRKYTGYITYLMENDFGLTFKNKIYFIKNNALPSFRKVNYRSAVEEALWFSKGKPKTFNFRTQQDMVQVYRGNIGHGKATKHPTEKYGWMIEPMILNHSAPGDVVLDPFSGSGSVLVHARKHGRDAIGFELNPSFYEMAKFRCTSENLDFDFGTTDEYKLAA